MKFQFLNSPNFEKRKYRKIKYIIVHYTGMLSSADSLKRLQSKRAKVSSHYFINEFGKTVQLVKDHNIAWHAGISFWGTDKNLNSKSIGIEIQNKGQEFGYHKFNKSQVDAAVKLILYLKNKYQINDAFILGHSDIAPLRKLDPGYLFPWNVLNKKGIGLLPKKNDSRKKLNPSNIKNLQILLRDFGYKISINGLMDKETLQVIHAFESHYCPEELEEFSIKHKLIGYLRNLIKSKHRSLTKKH
ncbi:N-acetylmuramoyl-L-alanine amidase [Pelagibacteraceae bacterium]|nr:N-acetylmuramoyl-L-alanine amidase [Pelagibacteraceae bacterium]